jgi:hypothetical protein
MEECLHEIEVHCLEFGKGGKWLHNFGVSSDLHSEACTKAVYRLLFDRAVKLIPYIYPELHTQKHLAFPSCKIIQ